MIALLQEIGQRYDRTPAQVALNAGALSFSLTDAEREKLSRATFAWRR